jgi:hypothetical protein
MTPHERHVSDDPGCLRFVTFDPREMLFWEAVMRQKLYVRLVCRRWLVTDIKWKWRNGISFIASVRMTSVSPIDLDSRNIWTMNINVRNGKPVR